MLHVEVYLPPASGFLLRFVPTACGEPLCPLERLLVRQLLRLVLPELGLNPALDALLKVIRCDPGPERDLNILTVHVADLDGVDVAALEHSAQDPSAYPLILGAVLEAAAAG